MKQTFAWINFVVLVCLFAWFVISRTLATPENHDHEWNELAEFGDDLFWLVPAGDITGRRGEIDVSKSRNTLIMHGPHATSVENMEQLLPIFSEFKARLAKHVDGTQAARCEFNLKRNGGTLGSLMLNWTREWSASGYPEQAHGGGARHYITLAATYERKRLQGTAVVHLSLEPPYGTLTIVEYAR